MTKYTIILEEDPETGDLIMPFPDQLLEEVNWKEGDTIEWRVNEDGSWTMRKKDGNESV